MLPNKYSKIGFINFICFRQLWLWKVINCIWGILARCDRLSRELQGRLHSAVQLRRGWLSLFTTKLWGKASYNISVFSCLGNWIQRLSAIRSYNWTKHFISGCYLIMAGEVGLRCWRVKGLNYRSLVMNSAALIRSISIAQETCVT